MFVKLFAFLACATTAAAVAGFSDENLRAIHFLRALSYTQLKDLEGHLRDLSRTKGQLRHKLAELNKELPKESRVGAFDLMATLPEDFIGPISKLHAILNQPTKGLAEYATETLAHLFNDDLTLVENCELNRKAFDQLSESDKAVLSAAKYKSLFRRIPVGPGPVVPNRCKLLGDKLKQLDLAAYLDPFALPEF
ncbi:hypothetical protein AAVH_15805 [Aphelenchoides avenae]|nr:hypothetical protein AAVH_15805 [Aphelenchus avenae]